MVANARLTAVGFILMVWGLWNDCKQKETQVCASFQLLTGERKGSRTGRPSLVEVTVLSQH